MQFQGIEKSLSKLVFSRKFVKSHFSKILHVSLTLTSLFENEIFVGKQNSRICFQSSHFSHTCSKVHSNSSSVDLQSSNAQMRLKGSKIGVYVVIIGEGKLKGHQINGSLPLGNIIGNLTLPQLMPISATFTGGWITLDFHIGLS